MLPSIRALPGPNTPCLRHQNRAVVARAGPAHMRDTRANASPRALAPLSEPWSYLGRTCSPSPHERHRIPTLGTAPGTPGTHGTFDVDSLVLLGAAQRQPTRFPSLQRRECGSLTSGAPVPCGCGSMEDAEAYKLELSNPLPTPTTRCVVGIFAGFFGTKVPSKISGNLLSYR